MRLGSSRQITQTKIRQKFMLVADLFLNKKQVLFGFELGIVTFSRKCATSAPNLKMNTLILVLYAPSC